MIEPQEKGNRYIKININSFYISIIIISLAFILTLSYLVFDKNSDDKIEKVGQNTTQTQNDIGAEADQGNKNKAEMNVTSASDPIVADLVEKVFKHIYLPSGDVKIETIVDVERLRANNPIFYQFAHDGDKILFYSDRAILYNPEVDKVLDVYHVLTK